MGPRSESSRSAGVLGPLLSLTPSIEAPAPTSPAERDFRARILAAAQPPQGLTAARLEERRAERTTRVVELRADLAGPRGAQQLAWWGAWLDEPACSTDPWLAAADLLDELEPRGLVERLGRALDEGPESVRRAGARRALHAHFGLWFETVADLEPFTPEVSPATRALYRERLLALERDAASQRALGWSTLGEAALALSDPSPDLRAAAALRMAEVLRSGATAGAEAWVEPVLEALRAEADSIALHAELELAQALLRDRDALDPELDALRQLLAGGLVGAPTAIVPSVARTLAALPVDTERPASWTASADALIDAVLAPGARAAW
ncbi:MAG: hypothetical protein AAFZ65_14495, partial [Planctomycetota bacterium]